MARSIKVNDIPNAIYDRLCAQAAADGVSVSELVRKELIEQVPEQHQLELGEWLAWLDATAPDDAVSLPRGAAAAALHAARAERF